MHKVFAGLGLAVLIALAGLGSVELRNRLLLAEGFRPVVQHINLDDLR